MTVEELYGDFIHKSRYARYLENQKRRETWQETVDRYIDFMSMSSVNYPRNLARIKGRYHY
jgi:hypothetical protein